MIDRLGLISLLAGCIVFAGILAAEWTATPAGDAAVAAIGGPIPIEQRASAVRSEPGARVEPMVAEILARPLFSSTRRPPPRSDGAAVELRAFRYATDRDHYRTRSSFRDFRANRSQATDGQRRRHDQRLADRDDHATRRVADRARGYQNPPAEDRSHSGPSCTPRAAGSPIQPIRPATTSPPRPGFPPAFQNRGPPRPSQRRERL